MSAARNSKWRAAAAALDLLIESYPQSFVRYERRRKPLKIRIHADLTAALDGAIWREVRNALRRYTSNSSYLRGLRAGAERIGLNGAPAGVVTAEQAAVREGPAPCPAAQGIRGSRPQPRIDSDQKRPWQSGSALPICRRAAAQAATRATMKGDFKMQNNEHYRRITDAWDAFRGNRVLRTTEEIEAAVDAVCEAVPGVLPHEIKEALERRLEEAKREREAAEVEIRREEAEVRHHEAWAERERAKGRPERELTWGNCVRETGILRHGGCGCSDPNDRRARHLQTSLSRLSTRLSTSLCGHRRRRSAGLVAACQQEARLSR
jgi:sRNA-binding protein